MLLYKRSVTFLEKHPVTRGTLEEPQGSNNDEFEKGKSITFSVYKANCHVGQRKRMKTIESIT